MRSTPRRRVAVALSKAVAIQRSDISRIAVGEIVSEHLAHVDEYDYYAE
jgi:hypothetical protein